ncbi:MAG: NADH-quinone oxidoreductase subunit C [Candidatus Eisenbacteria bacterium]|nr:NADH-quinone oxidoreductase subunit C [Candidatus Eisenbacteria bacterium]
MEVKEFRDEVTVVVRGGFIAEMARILRDEPELEYNFLSDLCGVDWPGRPERFEVVYNLYSMRHKSRLRLKVRLPESDPTVPTVSDVWPTANWHERETYDLFGIRFVGHPDLRRILNPDDFEVFPYRKDFPIR